MTRLQWGKLGDRSYEAGVDRGVFYPRTGPGVAWNGLVAVLEDPAYGSAEPLYFDGIKYVDVAPFRSFSGSIEAFIYPREFESYDGRLELLGGLSVGNQPRKSFDLAYRTLIGSDTIELGQNYKLHLVYNVTVLPSTRNNRSNAEAISPSNFQFPIKAVPVWSGCHEPTAQLTIDSRYISKSAMAGLEDMLYGTEVLEPRMPSQLEVIRYLADNSIIEVEHTIDLVNNQYYAGAVSGSQGTWHSDDNTSTTLSLANSGAGGWVADFQGDLTSYEDISSWRFEADVVSAPEYGQLKWFFEAVGEDTFNQYYNWSGVTNVPQDGGTVVRIMGAPSETGSADPYSMAEFLRRINLFNNGSGNVYLRLQANYVDNPEPVVLSEFRIIFSEFAKPKLPPCYQP